MTKSKPKSPPDALLLAVDAGGSKTAAWIVDPSREADDRIIGRGRASAGNPLSVGFSESTRAISEAFECARNDARCQAATVSRAVLSIAGAANGELRRQFITWAHDAGIAEHVAIVPDVLPVLAAGAPNCCGVAVVSGTGSVAFARAADGRTVLCGGWGFLLGDEGSGYAIGLAALQNCMHALESIAAHQPLAEATRKAIGANSIMELTKAIYQDSDPRGAIASVAPIVIAAAEEGDADAQAILDKAAHDLAKLVARTVRSIAPLDSPFALAVSGGILVGCQRMRDQLHVELRRIGISCELKVVDEPLEGCVRLAESQFAGPLVTWH